MIKKLAVSLLAMTTVVPSFSIAQDDSEEDVFELSPFTVDRRSGRGYRATSTLAGTRIRTDLKDVGSSVSAVTEEMLRDAGATIEGVGSSYDLARSGARGVKIDFGLGFYDDLEKVRRERLNAYLDQIRELVSGREGLYFEPGALVLPEGDKKRSKSKRKAEFTAYAGFSVSFDFREELSPTKRVMAIRRMVMELNLESEVTKVFYGEAGLVAEPAFAGTGLGNGVSPYNFGYSKTSDIGGTISGLVDAKGVLLGESMPQSPVSLVKEADAIRVGFVIDIYADEEAVREERLNAYLDDIRGKVEAVSGLVFEPGALLLSPGNRDETLGKERAAYASQAQFSVSFELAGEAAPMQRVRAVRRLVSDLDLSEVDGRVHYGEAQLVVRNADGYRGEIVKAIFADLKELAAGLGEDFVVEPTIVNTRVQLRKFSPTEVEVWIPYSYRVESVRLRDLDERKFAMRHEVDMATAQASAARCDCCKKDD